MQKQGPARLMIIPRRLPPEGRLPWASGPHGGPLATTGRTMHHHPPTPDPLLRGLVMITRHRDRPLSEADICAACGIPLQGLTVDALREAAGRLGYKAALITLAADKLVELPVPFIALPRDPAQPPVVVAGRWDGAFSVWNPLSDETRLVANEALLERSDRALLVRPRSGPTRGLGGRLWSALRKGLARLVRRLSHPA